METNASTNSTNGMELNQNSVKYLSSIQKWTYFFAIVGFIGIVILLLVGLLAKAIFSAINPQMGAGATVLGVIYIVFALIYFFPVLYLYRFSRFAKQAIQENNANLMEEALRNFKLHFHFIGVLTIAIFALYFVILLGYVLGTIFLG